MKEKIFTVVSNDTRQAVIKVNAKDNLTIALHPYISAEYDYINVTKGEDHVLTIIKKDGSTFSFHWGIRGYTLICESLEVLRREVVSFLKSENISLER